MRYSKYWFKRDLPPIPRYYGVAYTEYRLACDVCYPIPINYIVRYCRSLYWGFLRAFYWVGVIDTKDAEEFRWNDFWRIRNAGQ